jgi:hypothetical protein
MLKLLKIISKSLLSLLLIAVVLLAGYVIYMSINYYRIEDFQAIETFNQQPEGLELSKEYTALTYNIGFGAYNHDFSFFMDKGTMNDGTKVAGTGSIAKSKEIVVENTNGILDVANSMDADFCLFQEVDTKATRSYNVNQYEILKNQFSNHLSVYAQNFHSSYLMLPLSRPHGFVNSGLVTFSRYKVNENLRRRYPVDESFPTKFFDLDRCFLVSKLPVENGKELLIINSHMSAYDEGGLVREKQLALLNSFIEEEYKKGNYVVVGGDFNHEIAGMIDGFDSEQRIPDWVFPLSENNLAEGFRIVKAENYREVATCRSTDIPYTKGVNYVAILDGFIVSNNIEAIAENIDANFKFSDHNPVLLKFKLK